MMGDDSNDLIAIYDVAFVINEETTVAVAVVSNAEVKTVCCHCVLEGFEMGGAAVVVDLGVVAVVGVEESDFGAELLENAFANATGGAVGAVDGKFEAVEICVADIL